MFIDRFCSFFDILKTPIGATRIVSVPRNARLGFGFLWRVFRRTVKQRACQSYRTAFFDRKSRSSAAKFMEAEAQAPKIRNGRNRAMAALFRAE